jgi:hypothetical protein
MYLVACAAKNPLEVEFTRRAIEHIMWFDWHGYHTSKINQMVAWGWITVGETEDGLIAYRFTKAGHGQVAMDLGNSLANIRYVPRGQMELI